MELITTSKHKGCLLANRQPSAAELGLEQMKDNCGQKPERLWYGNTNAVTKVNNDADGSQFLLAHIDYEDGPEYTRI